MVTKFRYLSNSSGCEMKLRRIGRSLRQNLPSGLLSLSSAVTNTRSPSRHVNFSEWKSNKNHSEIHSPLDNMSPETKYLADQLLQLDIANDFTNNNNQDTSKMWQHRLALAKAITLVESQGREKEEQASALLTYLLQKSRPLDSFRIGFAGSPGAGKSTFIEALGKYVLDLKNDNNHFNEDANVWTPQKLSIVCIDPSSLRTGGSILGDKTRMTVLAADPRAFIRPSAAKGKLGGLAPRTDDVLRLLSHQYPLTFLETVGLGQSEVEVQQSVDMLILAIPPGGGDDLQGVKKGIVEVADLIVVTKADGNLLAAAKHTAGDYRGAMQFLNSITANHNDATNVPTPVLLTSAVTGTGLNNVWRQICDFRKIQIESGQLQKRRRSQGRYWMWKHLQASVHEYIENDNVLQNIGDELHHQLDEDIIPPRVAAAILFDKIKQRG